MKTKKFGSYRERFDVYLKKASETKNPEKKISFYNKILKIIKRLRFLEIKGKVSVKPSLLKLEEFFLEGKKDISDTLKGQE